jgi:RimJ/RimL family protein N-acetyltransferase
MDPILAPVDQPRRIPFAASSAANASPVGPAPAASTSIVRLSTTRRFGIGYWISEAFTGRGVEAAAVAAAVVLMSLFPKRSCAMWGGIPLMMASVVKIRRR